MLVRLVRDHARLFASIAVGIVLWLLLPAQGRSTTRLLVSWDVGVAVYLVSAVVVFARFDLQLVRRRAAAQDEGGPWLLMLTVAAAVASLIAIVAEVGSVRGTNDPHVGRYFGLAVLTIVLSWAFIHTIFALHYAHEYYGGGDSGCGLVFPNDERPDYWDFVYFSFVIGMTFQVSDVQVTSKVLRRMIVAHAMVSFTFTISIMSLVVNLGADVL